ncbi:MAG: hypothetical protein V6Z81_11320 [Parvularculales bacterium]
MQHFIGKIGAASLLLALTLLALTLAVPSASHAQSRYNSVQPEYDSPQSRHRNPLPRYDSSQSQFDSPRSDYPVKPFIDASFGLIRSDSGFITGTTTTTTVTGAKVNEYGFQLSVGLRHRYGFLAGLTYFGLSSDDDVDGELGPPRSDNSIPDGNTRPNIAESLAMSESISFGPFIAYDVPVPGADLFSVTPKLGVHFWNVDGNLSSGGQTINLSDDGSDVYYGVDVSYRIRSADNPMWNNPVYVSLGWDRFTFSSDIEDIDYFHLGLQVLFF